MKINERIDQLYKLGNVYAKAKGEAEYLKHFRKSKLAILKIKFSESDPKMSNARADDLARADKEYILLLEALGIAIEQSEAAYYELKIANAGISIYQTQRADRRAELNNLHNE